jgi:hypothetical protein
MPDAAWNNALKEKEKLLAEREAIDQRLQKIEHFLQLYAEFGGARAGVIPKANASGSLFEASNSQDVVPNDKAERGIPQGDFEKELGKIIARARRPLPKASLKAKLAEAGISIGGFNPEKNLSTKLWKAAQSKFIILPDYGYWFRAVSHPDSGYEASPAMKDYDELSRFADAAFSLSEADYD